MGKIGNFPGLESSTGKIDLLPANTIRRIGHRVLHWLGHNAIPLSLGTASAGFLLCALNVDTDVAPCPVGYNGPVVTDKGVYPIIDALGEAGEVVTARYLTGIDDGKVDGLVSSGWGYADKLSKIDPKSFKFGSFAGSLCTDVNGQYMLNPVALRWVNDYVIAFPKQGDTLNGVVGSAKYYHFPARSQNS